MLTCCPTLTVVVLVLMRLGGVFLAMCVYMSTIKEREITLSAEVEMQITPQALMMTVIRGCNIGVWWRGDKAGAGILRPMSAAGFD